MQISRRFYDSRIHFNDHPDGVYRAGEDMRAVVKFVMALPIKISTVHVAIVAKCVYRWKIVKKIVTKCMWSRIFLLTKKHENTILDKYWNFRQSDHNPVVYDRYEGFVFTMPLVVELPNNLPPSISTGAIHLRYKIVVLVKSSAGWLKCRKQFRIYPLVTPLNFSCSKRSQAFKHSSLETTASDRHHHHQAECPTEICESDEDQFRYTPWTSSAQLDISENMYVRLYSFDNVCQLYDVIYVAINCYNPLRYPIHSIKIKLLREQTVEGTKCRVVIDRLVYKNIRRHGCHVSHFRQPLRINSPTYTSKKVESFQVEVKYWLELQVRPSRLDHCLRLSTELKVCNHKIFTDRKPLDLNDSQYMLTKPVR